MRTPGLREGDCLSEPPASQGRLMPHFSAWLWVLWLGRWRHLQCACDGDVGMFLCWFWDIVNVVWEKIIRLCHPALALPSSTMKDTYTAALVWAGEEGCRLPWDLDNKDCSTPNIYDARYLKKFIRVGTATCSARCRSGRVAQPSSPRPCVLVEEEAEKE